MNEKENIDYILLNILKYYQKSGYTDILLTFENTPCDRLLFEIVRRNYDKFDNVYVTRAGCTVSAHCGRNTLGVLFIRKNIVK